VRVESDLPLRSASGPFVWVRALRVHQWAKNLLLVLPALAAHRAPTPALVVPLLLAFLSYSLLASAVYLFNDIQDVEHDRLHPTKRDRPIASGQMGVSTAVAAFIVLAMFAFALAMALPPRFRMVWAAYLVLSAAYSFGLKRIVVLDVMVLGALYTSRVIAGAAAVDVALSRWFLPFTVFFFSSLAILKRMVESQSAAEREEEGLAGRGWSVQDGPVLLGFGAACSVASALVYCLYITSDEVSGLYDRPDLLWLGLPILLYWLGRVWLLANRGEVHEDPVLFALRDRPSYLVGAALAAVLLAAA
jgi:4-hydroxybenzoate polyprenyltransferase